MLIKGEGTFEGRTTPGLVNPTSNAKPVKTGGIWDKITFSKGKNKQSEYVFPLSDLLTRRELYRTEKMTVFTDPVKSAKEHGSTDDEGNSKFDVDKVCPEIKMEDDIHFSEVKLLPADFKKIQEQLKRNPAYSKLLQEAEETFKPKVDPEKQWFRFGGSSTWLEQFEVHFMVSRLIYSPSGIPNKGFASFLYVQLFDRDWVEIEKELDIPYDQEIIQNIINSDGSITEVLILKSVAYRNMKFPSLLPIPFKYLLLTPNNKYYYGPEDPRILKRTNELGFEEPVVVYNLKDLDINKRVMFMYLPFSNKLKMLTKRSEPFADIEKNWTPFVSAKQPNTHLNFVYSINPLEVVTCEISTGVCDFIQKIDKTNINYFGPLRGGTQLQALPIKDLSGHLKQRFNLPENRDIYVGWARTHLNKCGCGESMYRPNMIVLVEDYVPETETFKYKMGVISDFMDFNADIPKWTVPKFDDEGKLLPDDDVAICDKSLRNVLIPNSIAYWEIDKIISNSVNYDRKYFSKISKADSTVVFNDYMGITLSAADADVKVVHVKGMLNYILKIDSLFDGETVVKEDNKLVTDGSDLNQQCSEKAAKDYCVRYAELNGGVVEYR